MPGPDPADPDCCVTSEWCRHRGFTFDLYGTQFQCVDVGGDGIKECVACTQESHCQASIDAEVVALGQSCRTNPQCIDDGCFYDQIPNCCLNDAMCDDGNSCTTDACDTDTGVCSNTAIDGCCIPGDDDLPIGAPTFGCTPPGADPCKYYTCIGQGAIAVCRVAS